MGKTRLIDLKDQIFGKLLVVEYIGNSLWRCICQCEEKNEVFKKSEKLKAIEGCSCGCYRKPKKPKHGLCNTKEYNIWHKMKSRCYNKNNSKYVDYGGRGITVCERWLESPINFIEDMGKCPENKESIDRIDNNGNYCKENCRWADKYEQANNTRRNLYLTFNNKTQTASEWERELGLPNEIITQRIGYGWSVEKALTTKPKSNYKKINK